MTEDNIVRDELGLKLDVTDVIEKPPSIILYGVSGSGKSSEMARAFPNCLFVQTNATVLRPYQTFLDANPDIAEKEGLKMPNRVTIPKVHPVSGEPLDPRPSMQTILDKYTAASKAGINPYDGIIFDEWTELSFRCFEAIQADPQYGKNNYARIDAIKELHYQLAALPQHTNSVLGLVCHELEPVFDMAGELSPTKGRLRYRGGPRMAVKSLTHEISSAMDIVLRILIEDDITGQASERSYITDVRKEWISKIRSFGLQPKEKLGLRRILATAKYTLKGN